MWDFFWRHRGGIGLVIFVFCVIFAFNEMQDDQLEEARVSAILNCQQGNFRAAGIARTVDAQKIVNKEFAAWLKSSAAFRRSQGEHALAEESEASRGKVLNASKSLVIPKQIDCARTYDTGHIVYKPSK